MSLYPSFKKEMLQDIGAIPRHMEIEKKSEPSFKNVRNDESSLVLHNSSTYKSLYPVLSEYMGLSIPALAKENSSVIDVYSKDEIASLPPVSGEITHGLRRLTLCKDEKNRVGLLVSAVNNGVFVCFVLKDSPAALGGLRFGDQILQINDTLLAGYSVDKVHNLIRKLPVNDINFIVRNRPFERTVSMLKDSTGHCGFQFHKGKIETLVKDSSAARNGLVTDHYILEVDGQNVVGMSDKEITKILANAGNTITITIIPSFLYEQLMKKMRMDFVKAKMDHSAHV